MIGSTVVAIDGPSGTGKSSVSKGVAIRLGMRYLDTGAMYRAVALGMLWDGIDVNDPEAVSQHMDHLRIRSGTDPEAPKIKLFAKGVWTDVSTAIREAQVTETVSHVSAVPRVRELLVSMQRGVVKQCTDAGKGVIVEGRDIGTVVLPDADVKVYLTASEEARAHRRTAEDVSQGRGGDVTATQESLARRDAIDSGRTVSPLSQAQDAVVVDATELTLEQVIDAVTNLVNPSS